MVIEVFLSDPDHFFYTFALFLSLSLTSIVALYPYGRSNGLAHFVRQTTTCTRRRSAAVLALMFLLILWFLLPKTYKRGSVYKKQVTKKSAHGQMYIREI